MAEKKNITLKVDMKVYAEFKSFCALKNITMSEEIENNKNVYEAIEDNKYVKGFNKAVEMIKFEVVKFFSSRMYVKKLKLSHPQGGKLKVK